MKNILQTTLLAAAIIVMAASCKKEETKIYFEGGTPPVLTADRAAITLSLASKDEQAVAFTWTNPNYSFTTGVSSQDVNYLLQIDTIGANFTNPNKQEVSLPQVLGTSFTVSQFNNYLIKMKLKHNKPHDLEMRVIGSINGKVSLASNVIQVKNVVPYKDYAIEPPSTGELYIIGGATPAGWGNPVPLTQQLTMVDDGLFEITLKLNADQSYLFLPKNGDWSHKYGGNGKDNNTNNPNGDIFKAEGSDLLAPNSTATYKIQVDFVTGRFTLTKQ